MMTRINLSITIFISLFCLLACGQKKEMGNEFLLGKIVVFKGIKKEAAIVYSENSSFTFEYEPLSGLAWFNTQDTFIGSENIDAKETINKSCNIVASDTSGEILQRLYIAKRGELAWGLFLSRDDKYLLFTTHYLQDPEVYPFEGLAPMQNLNIMDLKSKEVVIKIDSIGRAPNFNVKESPWLIGGYKFVYSLSDRTSYTLEGGEAINPTEEDEKGIYIFDMLTKQSEIIVNYGYGAIASPTQNKIAFETETSVVVKNLSNGKEKVIYKFDNDDRIFGLHWTPDGKSIYFAFKEKTIGGMFSSGEKLINHETGEEVDFVKFGLGFRRYSWR